MVKAETTDSKLNSIQRIEKLVSLGLIQGYPQHVRLCFYYLDPENRGYFTLKDLTEHGKNVIERLQLLSNKESGFTILNLFRSFDIRNNGKVKLQDFGMSLIFRIHRMENSLFDSIAAEFIAANHVSTNDICNVIQMNPESIPLYNGNMLLFSYYVKLRLESRNSSVANFNVSILSRILKESCLDAAKDLRINLQLPIQGMKKTFFELTGKSIDFNGMEDCEFIQDSNPLPTVVTTVMYWRQPLRKEIDVNRMVFEMTHSNSLKAEINRRSLHNGGAYPVHGRRGTVGLNSLSFQNNAQGSILYVSNGGFEGPRGSIAYDYHDNLGMYYNRMSILGTQAQKNIEDNNIPLFPNLSIVESALTNLQFNTTQIYLLQKMLLTMEGFVSFLPDDINETLKIGGNNSVSQSRKRLESSPIKSISNRQMKAAPLSFAQESELSITLTKEQYNLKVAKMRLEVLEMINNQSCIHFSDSSDTAQIETLNKVAKEITLDELLDSTRKLREIVASKGMNSDLYGSLISAPSIILPLIFTMTENEPQSIRGLIEDSHRNARKIKHKIEDILSLDANVHRTKLDYSVFEEKMSEFNAKISQFSAEHGDLSERAELQMLREKVVKMTHMERSLSNYQRKCSELDKILFRLERENHKIKDDLKIALNNALIEPDGKVSNSQMDEEKVLLLKSEISDLKLLNQRLQMEQQVCLSNSKQAQEKLKIALTDNLALNQKILKMEEELDHYKNEVLDLKVLTSRQRVLEEQKFHLSHSIGKLELNIGELKNSLLEAREEASMAQKLRDDLIASDNKVLDLQEKFNLATSTIESMKGMVNETEELRKILKERTLENRELNATIRAHARKDIEIKALTSRLEQYQQEINTYKTKVEQCAPMIAELARLRGASRAAVVSLQENDKVIASLQEKCLKDEKTIQELVMKLKAYEGIELKLYDVEADNSKMLEAIHHEIPLLKAQNHQINEEKKQIEIQYRQIKKVQRQTAITTTIAAAAAAFASNISSTKEDKSNGA